ncbi:hypothetical protein GJ496_002251 [Pomphorhynchus laevis]|nr:hypothetical protein GJ496_002251 [Pomphorhynchus laevis]
MWALNVSNIVANETDSPLLIVESKNIVNLTINGSIADITLINDFIDSEPKERNNSNGLIVTNGQSPEIIAEDILVIVDFINDTISNITTEMIPGGENETSINISDDYDNRNMITTGGEIVTESISYDQQNKSNITIATSALVSTEAILNYTMTSTNTSSNASVYDDLLQLSEESESLSLLLKDHYFWGLIILLAGFFTMSAVITYKVFANKLM